MSAAVHRPPRPTRLFAISAIVIAVTCVAIVRSRVFAKNPDVLAWGVTFDMTITIPLLYYLVVVRSRAARAITIIPVFVVSATILAFVLPRAYQTTLRDLRFIIAPLEVLTIILLVRRIAAMRHGESTTDPFLRFDRAARQVFGDTPVAGFLATEVAFLWYAVFAWNKKPDVPDGSRGFTVHERSGWGSVAACIVVLIIAEGIGLHLLVQLWSKTAAWVLTILDFYGLLWVLGDYNALRLRPSLIEGDVLRLRYGLRWLTDIRRDNVATLRATKGESDWKSRDVLKVAMIDDPRQMLELREPVIARGIAGLSRTIRAIAISPDQDGVLEQWLSGAQNAAAPVEPARAARQ